MISGYIGEFFSTVHTVNGHTRLRKEQLTEASVENGEGLQDMNLHWG